MTEAQKQFEAYYGFIQDFISDYDHKPTIFEAWQHQQQHIDELEIKRIEADKRATKYAFQNDVMALRLGNTESKLKIAVDALKLYSANKRIGLNATIALKQIEATS